MHVVIIGGGAQRPGGRDAARQGRAEAARPRAQRPRRRLRRTPRRSRRASAVRRSRTRPRSIRRSSRRSGSSATACRSSARRPMPARRRATAARSSSGTTPRAPREASAPSRRRTPSSTRDFLTSVARISGVLRADRDTTPPSIDDPGAGDLFELLKTGRAFRALGKADAYRLLRWMPMAVADLVGEWFESEPLRATIAAGGVLGSFLGPWSAGSAALLLLLGAGEGHPVASGWFASGGPGARRRRARTRPRGRPAPRSAPAPKSRRIVVSRRRRHRRDARRAAKRSPRARSSRAPIRSGRCSAWSTRCTSRRNSCAASRTSARTARSRRSTTRCRRCRAFTGSGASRRRPSRPRRSRDASASPPTSTRIERAFDAAKYGGFADEPWIELTIPSIADPALAPPGQHVVSAYVQYAPYHSARHDLGRRARPSRRRRRPARSRSYAPGFDASVIARAGDHAARSRAHVRADRRPHLPRRAGAGSVVRHAPAARLGALPDADQQLYLCGSGTHPGAGVIGALGRARCADDNAPVSALIRIAAKPRPSEQNRRGIRPTSCPVSSVEESSPVLLTRTLGIEAAGGALMDYVTSFTSTGESLPSGRTQPVSSTARPRAALDVSARRGRDGDLRAGIDWRRFRVRVAGARGVESHRRRDRALRRRAHGVSASRHDRASAPGRRVDAAGLRVGACDTCIDDYFR